METYQFKLKEYPRVVNYFINSFCLNLKLMNYIEDGLPDCDHKHNLIFLNESCRYLKGLLAVSALDIGEVKG